MRVLRTLADEDRRHLVTLGMTPVVTAQLDDPYCLSGMHHWLANWQLRAREATTTSRSRKGCAPSVFASTPRRTEHSRTSRHSGDTAEARCCAG